MAKAVVGIMYPTEWYGDPEGFTREVEALEALDVDVVVESYLEPHDLRSLRGKTDTDLSSLRDQTPALSDAQRAAFANVDAVMAIDLPFDVRSVAPKLRWVQSVGAGTGQLQSAGLADAGITLTSNAGSNSVAIAEFVVGRILGHYKRIREIEAAQVEHRWDTLYGRELAGATIGLIGLGAINEAVAQRLAAFDVRLLATRRSGGPGATAPNIDTVYATSDLMQVLPQCDVVVAAVPETPDTVGMMGAAQFAAMPAGSLFCNVGRGSLVDEPALIAALESGHLAGAALDVASVEPLPSDKPLWAAPNVYLSGHCSSSPAALFRNLHSRFRANLERFLAGEELRNVVDASRGY